MKTVKAWATLPLLLLVLVGAGVSVSREHHHSGWVGGLIGAAVAVAVAGVIALRRRRLYPHLY